LGIGAACLDHQRDLRIAADVHDLLRLPVRGHVIGAVAHGKVHRHEMREPVLVERSERAFSVLAQERRLFVRCEANIRASWHRYSPISWLASLSIRAQSGEIESRRSSSFPRKRESRAIALPLPLDSRFR